MRLPEIKRQNQWNLRLEGCDLAHVPNNVVCLIVHHYLSAGMSLDQIRTQYNIPQGFINELERLQAAKERETV